MINPDNIMFGTLVLDNPNCRVENSPYPSTYKDVIAYLFVAVQKLDNGLCTTNSVIGVGGPYFDGNKIPDEEKKEYQDYCEKEGHKFRSLVPALYSSREVIQEAVSKINENLSS